MLKTTIFNHNDLIKFIKASGLRRQEIINVKPTDIDYIEAFDLVLIHIVRSGRKAPVEVLRNFNTEILKMRDDALKIQGKDIPLLSEEIAKIIDFSDCRRYYAKELYQYYFNYLTKSALPEDRDTIQKQAVKEVANNLGHKQLGIVKNYIFDKNKAD